MKLQWDTAEACLADMLDRAKLWQWRTFDGKIYVIAERDETGRALWYVGSNNVTISDQLNEMGLFDDAGFPSRRAIQEVLEPLLTGIDWRWRKYGGIEFRLASNLYVAGEAGAWRLVARPSAQDMFPLPIKIFKTRRELVAHVYETLAAASAIET